MFGCLHLAPDRAVPVPVELAYLPLPEQPPPPQPPPEASAPVLPQPVQVSPAAPVTPPPAAASPVAPPPPRPVAHRPRPPLLTAPPPATPLSAPAAPEPVVAAPAATASSVSATAERQAEDTLRGRIRAAVQAASRCPAAARMMGLTGRAESPSTIATARSLAPCSSCAQPARTYSTPRPWRLSARHITRSRPPRSGAGCCGCLFGLRRPVGGRRSERGRFIGALPRTPPGALPLDPTKGHGPLEPMNFFWIGSGRYRVAVSVTKKLRPGSVQYSGKVGVPAVVPAKPIRLLSLNTLYRLSPTLILRPFRIGSV